MYVYPDANYGLAAVASMDWQTGTTSPLSQNAVQACMQVIESWEENWAKTGTFG